MCKSDHFLFFFTARFLYSQYKRNYKWIIIHDYSLDISIELQIIKLIKPSLVLRLNSRCNYIQNTHAHILGSNAPYTGQLSWHKIIRTRHRLVVNDGPVNSLLTKKGEKKPTKVEQQLPAKSFVWHLCKQQDPKLPSKPLSPHALDGKISSRRKARVSTPVFSIWLQKATVWLLRYGSGSLPFMTDQGVITATADLLTLNRIDVECIQPF